MRKIEFELTDAQYRDLRYISDFRNKFNRDFGVDEPTYIDEYGFDRPITLEMYAKQLFFDGFYREIAFLDSMYEHEHENGKGIVDWLDYHGIKLSAMGNVEFLKLLRDRFNY